MNPFVGSALQFTLDEEQCYWLESALEDFYFARELLRRVGEKERARFNEVGWPYGDSSIYGYEGTEVIEAQLEAVVKVLFGNRISVGL